MNWDQLKTVLWLRWRLTRNQWGKGGGIGAAVAAIVAVGAIGMAFTGFFGATAAGVFLLKNAEPVVIMAVWFGLTAVFFFLWLIGLIQDLQRSETIDLQRLMHLPVALGQIFVVNYIASHATVSVTVLVPAMIGLSIGLAISHGVSMLLLIPLALSMVAMITAWTYYLRGWLASLMSNPRRRRTVIMAVTAGFILLAQAPNLYFTVFRGVDRPSRSERAKETPEQREARRAGERDQLNQLIGAQKFVPPLWVPVGAQGLAEGRLLPALLGTIGCFGIAAVGLHRAYRSTVRFYQGKSGGKAPARAAAPSATAPSTAPVRVGGLFLERRLSGVPEQAAALALATFRLMLRAPEVKIQWATSFIVTLVVGAPLMFRAGSGIPDGARPFLATGIIVFSLFMLVQFLGNQFGLDRDGFRALVLSPVDRSLLLIGKNLACVPVGVSSALVFLIAVTVWLKLSPLVVLATVMQLAAGLLIGGLGGNLLSILVPYRVQAGSMKPTKMPGLAMLVLVLCQLAFPLAMAPLFAPPLAGFLWQRFGGPPAAVVNLALSVLLAGVALFAYWQSLGPLGRLLYRRETRILATVTSDVE